MVQDRGCFVVDGQVELRGGRGRGCRVGSCASHGREEPACGSGGATGADHLDSYDVLLERERKRETERVLCSLLVVESSGGPA